MNREFWEAAGTWVPRPGEPERLYRRVATVSEFMPAEVAAAIHRLAEAVMNETGRRLTCVQIEASAPRHVQMSTSGGVVDVRFAPGTDLGAHGTTACPNCNATVIAVHADHVVAVVDRAVDATTTTATRATP